MGLLNRERWLLGKFEIKNTMTSKTVPILLAALVAIAILPVMGMNDAFALATGWWSVYALWAYLIALIAILQVVKAFIVRERN